MEMRIRETRERYSDIVEIDLATSQISEIAVRIGIVGEKKAKVL